RVLVQRLVDQLLVAGADPPAADEDPPAVLADEAHAVLAGAGAQQFGAGRVGVLHHELGVDVVAGGPLLRDADGLGGDRAAVPHAQAPLGDVVVVGAPVGHLAAGVL